MILSNSEIHRALDEGRLKIDPEPAPRFPSEKAESPYQTSSVDLKLGTEISYFDGDLPVNLDLRQGGFASLFSKVSRRHELTEEQPFVLEPGKLVLGRTHERIELPLFSDGRTSLAARVEGRSSYARCGLLVHFTAPTIHAGFVGHITLELCNFGPHKISLFPFSTICQLILEEVSGAPFRNDSQFHGQSSAGGLVEQASPRSK